MLVVAPLVPVGEHVDCDCCGNGIKNNAEENVAFGLDPNPCEEGKGRCRECYGDNRVEVKVGMSEAAVRKRLGWAACVFIDARLDILDKRMNDANRKKLAAMSYERKADVVYRLVEKGVMV